MNTSQQTKRSIASIPALLLALLFGFVNCGYAWDYGNGRHGSYVLTTNATIEQLYQTVRLASDPAQYNPADSNAIPNFQNLIITNGATLTANAWNGSVGGMVVLKIQATMVVANGSSVSVNGLGYRGGGDSFTGQYTYGVQGESYAGSQAASSSANYGGGGGSTIWSISNGHPNYTGGGAGGGYGGSGESSLNNFCYCGAVGGGTYGTAAIDTLYLGSGGGGGPGNCTATGGNGGGAIEIFAGNIILLNGQIQANGAVGGYGSCGGGNVMGGGGSGGSIKLLVASAAIGTNNVTASGGSAPPLYKGAGNGGAGRIAIYYAESFTGVATPTAFTLQDTNSDNVTVITNQPATQTNFLAANVTFTVGVYGLPTLMFQWNFNGIPISGAANQSLSLNNIALTNTGNYSVTISNAVMKIVSSNAFLKVLDTAIPLGDGIPNWWKTQYGLSLIDPALATNYPSGDKLTYLEKYLYGLNPLTTDTDGDGLTDYDEIFVYHTNPLSADTDGDGIPDGWEIQHGMNPLVNDANAEAGFDGVTYMQIYQYDLTHSNQLDPRNPFALPGTSSYEILNNGQHTNKFYYDHEDRLLGMESSRGISIAYQYDGNGNLLRQTVLSRASETNGLPVLWRFLNGLTNNSNPYADSDGDGWTDYQELKAGTDPRNAQSAPTNSASIETAPAAVVLPTNTPLTPLATVTVRLWDNEGNASTPFLQYQILGATNWQNAMLTTLDSAPYNLATRVTALPTGNNHTLGWNALADVGPNMVTNILLRARAQDFMLLGDWSSPTPFQLNTAIVSIPTNPPVSFTGISTMPSGIKFNWQGGTNACLYLQRSPALGGTNALWINIWTGAPPTPISGSYTDFFGTNRMEFYRMKIINP
jgi:YD repeat-containing protein